LKRLAKKGCFLSFEWEKANFTTFGPRGKILKNRLVAPLKKLLPTPMGVARTFSYTEVWVSKEGQEFKNFI